MASSLPWMLIGVNLNRLDADGCPILERCATNAFGSVQPKTTKSEALADLTSIDLIYIYRVVVYLS